MFTPREINGDFERYADTIRVRTMERSTNVIAVTLVVTHDEASAIVRLDNGGQVVVPTHLPWWADEPVVLEAGRVFTTSGFASHDEIVSAIIERRTPIS